MPLSLDGRAGPALRAFVAVNLDPDLRDAFVRVQERLKATRADVGWVRPENLHLTLKFLGAVEEVRLSQVEEAVAVGVRGYGAFRLVFGSVGAFPGTRTARVVWIGLSEGAEALAALHSRVEATLQPLGFAREERPFTAHLTLGRVRGPGRREQLAAALISMPSEPQGEMVVRRIDLMRSDLSPGGARYSVLRSFPLG